jgi:hypothetical protein
MIIVLACVLLVVIAVSLVGTGAFETRKFIIFSVIASGLLTFFGFLWIGVQENADGALTEQAMRTAIAASAVASYLVLVGHGVFFVEDIGAMPPIAQALLTSFTTIVGIVLAFYFGSTAYLDAKKLQQKPDGPNKPLNADTNPPPI